MRNSRRTMILAVLVLAIAATAFGTLAFAKGKPGGGKCPDRLIFCLDYWDPVICDDGKVYSNECYARRACATGCQPYGDGGPVSLD